MKCKFPSCEVKVTPPSTFCSFMCEVDYQVLVDYQALLVKRARGGVMPDQLLPHQYHRAIGTVEKTPAHVNRVKAAQKREKTKHNDRSPKWPAVRAKFLRTVVDTGCAACGAKRGLQVHHVKPYHAFPKLELDPSNLLVLCEYVGGLECHAVIGHGGSFKKFNPRVREDAAALREDPAQFKSITAGAKGRALPNKPTAEVLPRIIDLS